jgi:phage shock protein E
MMRIVSIIVSLIVVGTLFISCTGRSVGDIRQDAAAVKTAITAQYRKISPQLAKEMIDSEEPLVIVDVRTEAEYAQGHIADALLLPNEEIDKTTPPQELPDLEAVILVYCQSGNRSAQAARKLVSLGYVNVYDFGGIIDWPYEIVR